jgi:hypothetical protein
MAIFLAVVFSHIHYDWGHGTSMLAVSVVGMFAAWMATALILAAQDLSRKLQALLLRRHQRIDNGRFRRR